jgi:mannose-1-phosphate guanylyltransferase/mannose-6-phosphate isomerase
MWRCWLATLACFKRAVPPKPFIKLGDGESLLQKAFLRGTNLNNVGNVLTVANRELIFKVKMTIWKLTIGLVIPS